MLKFEALGDSWMAGWRLVEDAAAECVGRWAVYRALRTWWSSSGRRRWEWRWRWAYDAGEAGEGKEFGELGGDEQVDEGEDGEGMG